MKAKKIGKSLLLEDPCGTDFLIIMLYLSTRTDRRPVLPNNSVKKNPPLSRFTRQRGIFGLSDSFSDKSAAIRGFFSLPPHAPRESPAGRLSRRSDSGRHGCGPVFPRARDGSFCEIPCS